MNNTFELNNNTRTAKMRIAHLKPGQVFFHGNTSFVKLAKPFPSQMQCDACGEKSPWNVHNFSSAVHFCTNQEYEITLTDFILDFPQS